MSHLNKYIKTKYNIGNTWNVRNGRLLTNGVPKSELEQSESSDNITVLEEKNALKDITGSSEIHEKKEMDTSNSMYTYITKLEHGYPNKKGLKRLDCLYEKKLFEEMYKLDKSAGNKKSKNSYFKKVFWKRYGLRFVIFSLILLFGIVTSIMCNFGINRSGGANVKFMNIGTYLLGINGIFYIPSIIAFLYFITYILSKIGKYKRLKKSYDKI
ncbi:hypothetical protein PVBG_01360 [Plasmodium vivax Brazil I]|uniref:Variable surface protein Vir35 n=1 Tax=Plasmodium vivax (strain Brazil I) TaxID=1033975 RepID=A0A0J9SRY7_PLAV1|nr:hypothetical protein PVBG_01360 [Plasmodium vivax Brazil I]